jgi:phage host-nuclease inhibitor protein Gam
MVRHKQAAQRIATIEELDRAIRVVGLCDMRLEQIDQQMDIEIRRIKTEAQAAASEIKVDREALVSAAHQFVAENREQVIGRRQSRTLNYGKVGFRKSPDRIDMPRRSTVEMDELCERVEELGKIHTEFQIILPRIEKYLLKADVSALHDNELEMIGLERLPGRETFFADANRAKLVEVDDAK